MPDLFENKLTTRKGDVGESLVDKMLREKGFVIYKPVGRYQALSIWWIQGFNDLKR